MEHKRHISLKIKTIVVGLVGLLILWFGTNLGLYYYLKTYITTNKTVEKIDAIPTMIRVPNHVTEQEKHCLLGLAFDIPFHYERINLDGVTFLNHQVVGITAVVSGESDLQVFLGFTGSAVGPNNDKRWNIESLIHILLFDDLSVDQLNRLVYHSRFQDYSLWNVLSNIRLLYLLILKSDALSTYDNIYEIETPHVSGFLTEQFIKRNQRIMSKASSFRFSINDHFYTWTLVDYGSRLLPSEVLDYYGSVQPQTNVVRCDQPPLDKITWADNIKYPVELQLLFEISSKGPTIDNLRRLVEVGKDHLSPDILRSIEKEIEILYGKE